jgi:hypothetical protein
MLPRAHERVGSASLDERSRGHRITTRGHRITKGVQESDALENRFDKSLGPCRPMCWSPHDRLALPCPNLAGRRRRWRPGCRRQLSYCIEC